MKAQESIAKWLGFVAAVEESDTFGDRLPDPPGISPFKYKRKIPADIVHRMLCSISKTIDHDADCERRTTHNIFRFEGFSVAWNLAISVLKDNPEIVLRKIDFSEEAFHEMYYTDGFDEENVYQSIMKLVPLYEKSAKGKKRKSQNGEPAPAFEYFEQPSLIDDGKENR